MVDKVEITDPYRADPSLRDKSLKQLEQEITLRQMAIDDRRREERKASLDKLVTEINAAQDAVVTGLKFLDTNNMLNEQVKQAFTTTQGTFAPHLKFKAIDAERLLGRMELVDNPKKTRKARGA